MKLHPTSLIFDLSLTSGPTFDLTLILSLALTLTLTLTLTLALTFTLAPTPNPTTGGPLHVAAARGHVPLVRALLNAGAIDVSCSTARCN